ncbi:hypothetical protein P170DRAFT_479216 [Aspergillus steynii IBT 23096]|uniref:Oxo-4-hydroxy-4-carboxy-5-ureidoimidazoline decarboxylase domain-containing protein n=1 Tax=Aspergillus steynii IBT 23096 TaxID=1392250 RepID=A0A2I2G094_9EURO|nr:uncharacterized protein P170DRAFT_479216 [Aspergillus steynii IBT 23096]PLB46305.1 hypothetical protein P170DRAFT_479216 [Aspergillus steynii IBT 23096]
MSLPPSHTLPSLSQPDQFRVLDTLFESSADLHALMAPVLASEAFASYAHLVDAVGTRLSALATTHSPADRTVLLGILGSHPRLGRPPTVEAEALSELSRQEQAQLNAGAQDLAEQLARLNAEYEQTFPGLRFVTFVNGRSRPEIMAEMRRRIDRGQADREIEATIQAMCEIGQDRARKLEK